MNAKAEHYDVIVKPLITEKATIQGMHNVYTFNVAVDASKTEIAKAIFSQSLDQKNDAITFALRKVKSEIQLHF